MNAKLQEKFLAHLNKEMVVGGCVKFTTDDISEYHPNILNLEIGDSVEFKSGMATPKGAGVIFDLGAYLVWVTTLDNKVLVIGNHLITKINGI